MRQKPVFIRDLEAEEDEHMLISLVDCLEAHMSTLSISKSVGREVHGWRALLKGSCSEALMGFAEAVLEKATPTNIGYLCCT